MEAYKKSLKKKAILWMLVLIVSVAGIGLFFVLGRVLFGMDVELRRSFGGMFSYLLIISFIYNVNINAALTNEKKLKEQYIRSTDERNINIEAKSARVTLNIVMVSLFVAFLLLTLFLGKNAGTVPGIAFYGIWLIKIVVKSYYNKKM
ncbi:MAG: hypothetical protein J6U00_10165 [Ruminococcus sp.]|uniref:hypothetical protein n=1 Tax=Ruminococcus sp. TaxID=41978 RepID=UPI001B09F8A3|nr:hypothetical protein [Ruminococcus sp.]MBO7474341.1 hypothetical protein [Ruminococcus sp.]